MAEAALAVERLSLAFGGLRVLANVSFSVRPGELLALIGPNGAGKTSILNCIGGIYRPSAGRVVFEGRDVTGTRPHTMARLGLARTFQHGELFAQMSVLDNLMTGRHTRIRTNPLAEMLFLPGVRREEVRHREAGAVERMAKEPRQQLIAHAEHEHGEEADDIHVRVGGTIRRPRRLDGHADAEDDAGREPQQRSPDESLDEPFHALRLLCVPGD